MFSPLRAPFGRQVRAALAAVDDLIPVPWDLPLLIQRLARRRQRPIRLLTASFPPGEMSGLYLSTEREDLIFYDLAASPTIKEQIVGHELGHMLMGHQLAESDSATPMAESPMAKSRLTAEISPALVQRFLARTAYDNRVEVAAEEFGTRLLENARRHRPLQDGDPIVRLADSLMPWLAGWHSAHRGLRCLQPLWTDLTAAHRGVVLPSGGALGRRTEFAFDRRMVETSECLRLVRLPGSAADRVAAAADPVTALARELVQAQGQGMSTFGVTAASLLPVPATRADETTTLLDLAAAYTECVRSPKNAEFS